MCYIIRNTSGFIPVLFLLYVNDINKAICNKKVVCYVDDTVIIISENSWEELFPNSERDMQEMKTWLNYDLITKCFKN